MLWLTKCVMCISIKRNGVSRGKLRGAGLQPATWMDGAAERENKQTGRPLFKEGLLQPLINQHDQVTAPPVGLGQTDRQQSIRNTDKRQAVLQHGKAGRDPTHKMLILSLLCIIINMNSFAIQVLLDHFFPSTFMDTH